MADTSTGQHPPTPLPPSPRHELCRRSLPRGWPASRATSTGGHALLDGRDSPRRSQAGPDRRPLSPLRRAPAGDHRRLRRRSSHLEFSLACYTRCGSFLRPPPLFWGGRSRRPTASSAALARWERNRADSHPVWTRGMRQQKNSPDTRRRDEPRRSDGPNFRRRSSSLGATGPITPASALSLWGTACWWCGRSGKAAERDRAAGTLAQTAVAAAHVIRRRCAQASALCARVGGPGRGRPVASASLFGGQPRSLKEGPSPSGVIDVVCRSLPGEVPRRGGRWTGAGEGARVSLDPRHALPPTSLELVAPARGQRGGGWVEHPSIRAEGDGSTPPAPPPFHLFSGMSQEAPRDEL